jgi:hypothetical protein
MKMSFEKIVKIFFIMIIITAMAVPRAVFAQDELPTDPPPTEVVTEAPVVEETAAPTEAPVVEETAAPTEAPVIEETDITTEVVTVVAVETAAPTEVPEVEEELSEVVTLLTEEELVIVDENGDALPMASQEAADVISSSDPFFWDGTQWVGYTSTTGTCPSFVAVCNQVANPFTTALTVIPADSTLYVQSGYYDEEVTVSTAGLSFTAFNTISGVSDSSVISSYTDGFASIRALILDAAFNTTLGVYADEITVTENGYLSDALNLANPVNEEATINADVIGSSSGGTMASVQDAYHPDDTQFEWECGEPDETIHTGEVYRMVLKNPKSADVLAYYGTNAEDETSDLIIGASMSEQTTLSFMDPDMTCPSGTTKVGGICTKNPSCDSWWEYWSSDNLCHLWDWTSTPSCPSGMTLNPTTDKCEKPTTPICQTGTVYNAGSGMCDLPAWSNLNEQYEFWKLLNKQDGQTDLTTPIFNYIQDHGSSVPITQKVWFLWPSQYCDDWDEGHDAYCSWYKKDGTCRPGYYHPAVAPHCDDWDPTSTRHTQLTFLKLPIPQTGCTDPALCPMPNPDFSIEKTVVDPQSSYDVGDTIHYSVAVTNTGNVALPDLTITDAKATFDVAGCGDAADLAVGATRTCAASHTVLLADTAGTYTNTAIATSGEITHSDSVDITIPSQPEFNIEKTVIDPQSSYSVGDTIHYSIVVTNIGNVDLPSLSISDPGVVFDSPGCGDAADLVKGASRTCNVSLDVTSTALPGSYTNTATANSGDITHSSSVDVTIATNPDISIEKSITSEGPYTVGTTITYSLVVTNVGDVTLTDVTVSDPNADFVGTCSASSLDPEGSFTCVATHLLVASDFADELSYLNTATATGVYHRTDYTSTSSISAPLDILGCMDPAATNYNASATISDGSCTYPPPPPGPTPDLGIPVTGATGGLIPVTGGTLIVSGLGHSCMTYNNGQVICWGLNGSGQLGDGTTIDKTEPVYVKDLTGVMNLTAGSKHTCALNADGEIWCWGENSSGQLGNGSTANSSSPVKVTGLPDKVLSMTAGEEFTCAQLMNQEVWCWGKNDKGQLNDGTTTNQTSPVKSKLTAMLAQISGGQGVLLGSDVLGSVNEWIKAQAAAVKELESSLSISANRWGDTGCAVAVDGSVKCWGSDLLSAAVAGALPAMEVGTGLDHNCTINSDLTVSCWGSNDNGQLGNGTNTDSDSATLVKNMSLAKVLAVGAHHTCVLSGPANTPMCWGENTFGQLGNGSTSHSNLPVLVVLPQ